MQRRQFILGAAAGLAVPSLVWAADMAGPVRILVGFAPGGGTDVLARVLGNKLTQMWNTSVVVENKPGASGSIAAGYVAKQPPDGTTLLMAHVNSHAIAPAMLDLKYNPRADFSPIAMVGVTPNMLTCRAEQKVRTVAEVVALCKQKPGKVSFGSSGIGSSQHLALELFRMQAKIDVVHVPYKGSGPLVADLLGGQIDYAFDTMTAATPFIQQEKVVAIAQTRLKRAAAYPNVPTLAESGFPGLDAASWYGLVGPKGMSPALVARMNADVNRALAMPDVVERLKSFGAEDYGGSSQQFGDFIASEATKWAKVVKDANVKAEI